MCRLELLLYEAKVRDMSGVGGNFAGRRLRDPFLPFVHKSMDGCVPVTCARAVCAAVGRRGKGSRREAFLRQARTPCLLVVFSAVSLRVLHRYGEDKRQHTAGAIL